MTRSVANGTGTPVHIKDADGNLQALDASGANLNRLYLAGQQVLADYPAKANRYNGSVMNNATTSTLLGSFTNTVHQSEGDESVTTINSTTTPLHQLDDALISLTNTRSLMSVDDVGNVYQMNDAELEHSASQQAEAFYRQDYPGFCFWLSAVSPHLQTANSSDTAADWELWDFTVFSDTRQNRVFNFSSISSTDFSIWRSKRSGLSFSGFDDTYGTGIVYQNIFGVQLIQQATDVEVGRSMMVGLQKLRANTGVGNYIFLASGDTLPSGTWVAKGTASDFRRTVIDNVDFVGTRDDLQFNGHRNATAGAVDEQYVNSFTGQKFAGTRDYSGTRDNIQFTGQGLSPTQNDYTLIETYTLYVKVKV